jgi:hypothetical protein
MDLRARVRVPLGEDEIWTASIRLVALFASTVPVAEAIAQDFARQSGVFLVWPYARTVVTTLSQIAGVTAPVLPLLTRPGQVLDASRRTTTT